MEKKETPGRQERGSLNVRTSPNTNCFVSRDRTLSLFMLASHCPEVDCRWPPKYTYKCKCNINLKDFKTKWNVEVFILNFIFGCPTGDRGDSCLWVWTLVESSQWLKNVYLSLALGIIRVGQGLDWVAQWQDNVTQWDIRSWYWWLGLSVGQYYKTTECTLSQTCTHPDIANFVYIWNENMPN